jgi:hypothetical protein
MYHTKQTAKHLREVFTGGNWTWSNFKDVLSDVDFTTANQKMDSLNTIVALTYHIGYYVEAILGVMKNKPLNAKDEFSFNHPVIDSEGKWKEMQNQILSNVEELACLLEQLPDEKLETIFVETKYGDYFRNFHGLIEHTHYHLGQIVIIKKCLLKSKI